MNEFWKKKTNNPKSESEIVFLKVLIAKLQKKWYDPLLSMEKYLFIFQSLLRHFTNHIAKKYLLSPVEIR